MNKIGLFCRDCNFHHMIPVGGERFGPSNQFWRCEEHKKRRAEALKQKKKTGSCPKPTIHKPLRGEKPVEVRSGLDDYEGSTSIVEDREYLRQLGF
jgi:hypothetical protein